MCRVASPEGNRRRCNQNPRVGRSDRAYQVDDSPAGSSSPALDPWRRARTTERLDLAVILRPNGQRGDQGPYSSARWYPTMGL